MSITNELREYATVSWDPWPEARDRLLRMCDRIDAEHERKVSETAGDWDYWESTHVELPKDADGEHIHIGDMMEERSGHTFEVALMTFGGSDNWLVLSNPQDLSSFSPQSFPSFREPHDIRHYKPPTVEDVLKELLYKAHIYDEREMEFLPDLIAEYAAKLRLAGDAE